MSRRDDRDFRLRPGKAKGGTDGRYVSRVLQATGKQFAGRSGKSGSRGPRLRGRGHVAATLGLHSLGVRARRVVVKARLLVLKGKLPAATTRHLRYLERQGPDTSDTLTAYSAVVDEADTGAFTRSLASDRHQFRLILAPEDGVALGDLRQFTRAFMTQVERDLATRLDWVAVDHWDTDNPHTHIVLRGKAQDGQDLVISRDYISHGMRARAQDIATEWLGPRTEQEIRAAQTREIEANRWTAIDRGLQREAQEGVIDLRPMAGNPSSPQVRALRLGRLAFLAQLDLAEERSSGVWQLRQDWESTLRHLGERGDIVRTVQQALGERGNDFAIYDPQRSRPITGRVAARGLADELQERGYLILEGIDGRAHYVKLAAGVELKDFPLGHIVTATGSRVTLESTLPLTEQRRAIGATWLDQQLLNGGVGIGFAGFGGEVRQALAARAEFLIGEGLAEEHQRQLRISPRLLATLRDRELTLIARQLATQTGKTYQTAQPGGRVAGTYRRALHLTSGLFALIETASTFTLVPWARHLDRDLGREVTGRLTAHGVAWQRMRSPGLQR